MEGYGKKKLGFGCMRLPQTDKEDAASIEKNEFHEMADYFLEQGFTYFDTAYMYHGGKSEEAVGEGVTARHPRESFTVTSKLPIMFVKSEEDQEAIFQEQMERCKVDYFDYYMIHNLGVAHYEMAERFHSFDFVSRKKKEGKIGKMGFSFHDTAAVLDQILTEHPEVDFVQLQINYLDWESDNVQSRLCYEVARKHKKDIIVMEPVKGGTLARVPRDVEKLFQDYNPGASIPSWAIRFAAGLEGVVMVLSGMSDMDQMKDNTSYMKEFQPLNEEEKAIVDQAARLIRDFAKIPCTECRYCVDGCPKKIAIPNYFMLYNKGSQSGGGFGEQRPEYEKLAETNGKASDCINCKKCEKSCPQHIVITERLKDVAGAME